MSFRRRTLHPFEETLLGKGYVVRGFLSCSSYDCRVYS